MILLASLSWSLCSCTHFVMPLPHTTEAVPRLQGKCLDARTSEPITGVQVCFLTLPDMASVTDLKGSFSLGGTKNFHLLMTDGTRPNEIIASYPRGRHTDAVLVFSHPDYHERTIRCESKAQIHDVRDKKTGALTDHEESPVDRSMEEVPVECHISLTRRTLPRPAMVGMPDSLGIEWYRQKVYLNKSLGVGQVVSLPDLLVDSFELVRNPSGRVSRVIYRMR